MTFLVQKIKCYVVNIQYLTAACETFKANPLASIVKKNYCHCNSKVRRGCCVYGLMLALTSTNNV